MSDTARSSNLSWMLLLFVANFILAGCASGDPVSTGKQAANRTVIVDKKQSKESSDAKIDLECTASAAEKRKYKDYQDLVNKHVLIAQSDGRISLREKFGGEAYEKRFIRIIKAFAKAKRENEDIKILIYLNGGLNNEATVLNQAARQIPCMLKAKYFPIFLIWDTGPLSTYYEQIKKVRNGRFIRQSGLDGIFTTLTAPMHVVRDVVQGIGGAPATFSNSTFRFLNSTNFFGISPLFDKEEYSLRHFQDTTPRWERRRGKFSNVVIDENVKDDPGPDVISDATYLLVSPVRLITIPFLDSFGKTAWENMKRRSRTTFHSVRELQPETRKGDEIEVECEIYCYPEGTGVFSMFFQDLARWQAAGPEPGEVCEFPKRSGRCGPIPLTVIGHSMGTMVLNEAISRYSKQLRFENIVYLAAATTIREFQNTVQPALHDNTPRSPEERTSFYSLMLHPLREAKERTVIGAAGSGSLLEWIDDIFEGPQTVLDRTLGMWRNVKPAIHVLNKEYSVKNRMKFRVFGYGEALRRSSPKEPWRLEKDFCPGNLEKCKELPICDPERYWPQDPRSHGGFNDDTSCFWVKEYWANERPTVGSID